MFIENSHIRYFLLVLCVTTGAVILANILRGILHRMFKNNSSDNPFDPTKINFLKNAINFMVSIMALVVLFYSIPDLKALGVTLFASAGIVAAVVGFASQAALSNIISGVFIVMFKPFRVGDVIEVGEDNGIVEDITLRHTIINSFQNRRIIIPNSVISSVRILNSTIKQMATCSYIEMSISYDSNIDKAMQIMREEALKHPLHVDNRTEEEIEEKKEQIIVRLISFGDSSVNLRAYVWCSGPIEAFELKCDIYKSVKERFDAEGIEIPYPYRTLVFKNESDKNKFKS